MSAIEQITLQGMLNAFNEEEIKDLFENFSVEIRTLRVFCGLKQSNLKKQKKPEYIYF